MKTLGKLKLNPETLLNQDELVSFRGGSGDLNCTGYGTNKCSYDGRAQVIVIGA